MATTDIQLQVILRLAGFYANGNAPFADLVDTLNKNFSLSFTFGTGASQATNYLHGIRTLAASANESLDFHTPAEGYHPFGGGLTGGMKVLFVRAPSTNAAGHNVRVTRPANGIPWLLASGDGLDLEPGASMLFCNPSAAGVAVTSGTGDLINFANTGGSSSITYEWFALGEL